MPCPRLYRLARMAGGRRRNCGVVVLVVLGALGSILASCGSSNATTTPPITVAQGSASPSAAGPTTTDSAPATTPPTAAPDTATAATDPAPQTDSPTTSVSEPILPAATIPQRVPPIKVTCTGAYVANDTLPLTPCQKGSVVADVQNALVGFGYDITADGLYGQATADAVQSFQYVMGLPETGVVDEATWTALGIDAEVDF